MDCFYRIAVLHSSSLSFVPFGFEVFCMEKNFGEFIFPAIRPN